MSTSKKNSKENFSEKEVDELLSLLSTCDEYRRSFEDDPISSLKKILKNHRKGYQENHQISDFTEKETPTLATKEKISHILNAFRSKSSNEFAMLPIMLNIEKNENTYSRKKQPAAI